MIKYFYHRHQLPAYQGEHVLCIAREVNGNKVKFGWAICTPPRWVPFLGRVNKQKVKGWKLEGGDTFSRAKGRELAVKRLNESPIYVSKDEGEHPIDACLFYLKTDFNLNGHCQHPLASELAYVTSVARKRWQAELNPQHKPEPTWLDRVKGFFGISA